jgi:hypothetical protein
MSIYTGSTCPTSIAHAVHNAAWNVLGATTLISAAPVLVDVYLVCDFGVLILIGTPIGAVWIGHRFKRGMDSDCGVGVRTPHRQTYQLPSQHYPAVLPSEGCGTRHS